MELTAQFLKAMASGFLLVVGCCVLLASGNIYIGSVLFTVALCGICNFGLPLYTGAVGYVSTAKEFKMLWVALFGNMAGCAVLGVLVSFALPEISVSAAELVNRRVYPPHIGFILSLVCGMLMYTAVHTFRSKQSYIGILTCVPAFIIGGFEHSIAYMGFMGLGRTATPEVLANMLVFVAGNGIGAIVISLIAGMGNTAASPAGNAKEAAKENLPEKEAAQDCNSRETDIK